MAFDEAGFNPNNTEQTTDWAEKARQLYDETVQNLPAELFDNDGLTGNHLAVELHNLYEAHLGLTENGTNKDLRASFKDLRKKAKELTRTYSVEEETSATENEPESTEVIPSTVESIDQIEDAATDATMEQTYSFDPETFEVTYADGLDPKQFATSELFAKFEAAQQTWAAAKELIESGEEVPPELIGKMQDDYDTIKLADTTAPYFIPDTVPHESLPDVVEASEDPVEPFEIEQSVGMQHFNALHEAAVENKKRADLAPEALDDESTVVIIDNSDTQQSLESDFSDASVDEAPEEPAVTTEEETPEQATAARLEQSVSDASAAKIMDEQIEVDSPEADTEQLSDVEVRKLVFKEIDRIEAPSRFFRWLRSPSPVALLEETSFEQFEVLLQLSKRDFDTFTSNEYRGMDLDYGPFQKWANYLNTLNTRRQTGMEQLSQFAETIPPSGRTTKAVMEGFIAQQLGL